MNEQMIPLKISSMEAEIQEMVHQRTLQQYTAGPVISRARLFFLLIPEFGGMHWSDEIRTSAKTVAIIYAALHAHDLIEEHGTATKEQQLTVLAGDFYSGIYYQLLANLDNIDLIRELASAVVTVSEQKASFHTAANGSLADFDRSIHSIESSLIEAFYRFYGYERYSDLSRLVLVYERYAKELQLMQAGGTTPILRKLDHHFPEPAAKEAWFTGKLEALEREISEAARACALPYAADHYLHQLIPHKISIKLSN